VVRFALLALLVLATVLPATAHAQYDPALRWFTLRTPHFRLHFHQGELQLAQRAARAAEAARARLSARLGVEPDLTDVVLADNTDFANGFATTLFYNHMQLNAVPPGDLDELNDYDDWLWQLVAHETTHIVNLGDIRGLPDAVNHVLGQVDVPNGVQPRWLIEGLAVFEESNLSSSGRVRSSLYEMYLRAQRLRGGLFRLDQTSNEPTSFPRGTTAYLYGSRLLAFIAAEHGEASLAAYSHAYGRRLVPFELNLAATASLGEPFSSLYARWSQAEQARLDRELAKIRAEPVTKVALVTHAGDFTGAPRFIGSTGRIAYLERSADRPPELRSVGIDASDDRRIAKLPSASSIAISRDGSFAVLSRDELYREFSDYLDLWRIDLRTGDSVRLTRGLRTREPDLSPDGSTVACAVDLGAASMALALVPLNGDAPRVVFEPRGDVQLYGPRFSPDGQTLVFSEHRGAHRDLALLDLKSGEVRRLTADDALDLDPVFDPSGGWVVFSSDRTGVYNLYALPLDGGPVKQLTNLETGAFAPDVSPDGRTLAFTTFTRDGFDVATTPLELAGAPAAPPSRDDRPAPPYTDDPSVAFPVEPYSPWPTLLPKYWLPILTADAAGTAIGAITSGADILSKHQYALELYYGFSGRELGGNAQYTNHQLYPAFTLSVTRALHALAGGPAGALERQSAGDIGVDVPFDQIASSLHLDADYEIRRYTPLWQPALAPDAPTPFFPRQGIAGSIGVGVSFSTARGSPNGISPEQGYTLRVHGRAASPSLGGSFSYVQATARATTYLRMPWSLHQILALRIEGGLGEGDLLGRSLFSLGGASFDDPILAILQGGSGDAGLRGYPGAAFRGNQYALGSAEYRFPIADLDRGIALLPVYLRRIHAAVFADVGEAADHLALDRLAPSAGAELDLDTLLAYQLPFTFRLGLARGLARRGITSAYLLLGGSY